MKKNLKEKLKKIVYTHPLALNFFKRIDAYFISQQIIPSSMKLNEQVPMVVIIPSYNNVKFCEKNLLSVFSQEYQNYRVIYIDDCSPDNTYKKVEEVIERLGVQDRIKVIRNEKNLGAMHNLYEAIHSCKDNEVVVTLDGDDWLAHEDVLSLLNQHYSGGDVWMTYGQFIHYPSYIKGFCAPIPEKMFQKTGEKSLLRSSEWLSSHLRTFYAGLFKKIKKEDFLYEDKFVKTSWDLAMMFPMLEMSEERARFIPQILYTYNCEHPLNDHHFRPKEQKAMELHFRSLPSYQRLDSLL